MVTYAAKFMNELGLININITFLTVNHFRNFKKECMQLQYRIELF